MANGGARVLETLKWFLYSGPPVWRFQISWILYIIMRYFDFFFWISIIMHDHVQALAACQFAWRMRHTARRRSIPRTFSRSISSWYQPDLSLEHMVGFGVLADPAQIFRNVRRFLERCALICSAPSCAERRAESPVRSYLQGSVSCLVQPLFLSIKIQSACCFSGLLGEPENQTKNLKKGLCQKTNK